MSEFIERSLMDLVSFIVDNRGRTCPVSETGFPLIATNCVVQGRRDVVFQSNVRYVDEETRRTWFRAHPEPGDVLLVCKGNAGRVAVVPDPVPYCIAQDMVALRAKRAVVDPLYLYYRLVSRDVQERIANMHVGSLIPHFKKGDFRNLVFPIHADLGEQRRISAALGAFDDLIETNRALKEDLILLAQALLAKTEWPIRRVGDVAVLNRGLSYKGSGLRDGSTNESTPMVNLANFSTSGWIRSDGLKYYGEHFKPSQVLDAGDLVVANTDLTQAREILGRGVLIPPRLEGAIHSHHTTTVRFPGHSSYVLFLWAQLQQPSFRARALGFATGTTVTALPKDAILDYEFHVPVDADHWARRGQVLVDQVWALEEEIADLDRARAELLPLLMSGKIRVQEVEEVLA